MLHTLLLSPAFLGVTYDGLETWSASGVFQKRSANCVGFTNLYIALARHYGLTANYPLNEQYPHWSKIDNIVSIENHVSTRLSLRNGWYLDVDINRKDRQVNSRLKILSDKQALAIFYNNLAMQAFKLGAFQTAIGMMARAIEASPDNATLWSNLGVLYRNNQQLDAAEQMYTIALTLSPKSFTTMNNLAVMYNLSGREQQYQYYLNKISRLRQKKPYYHYHLAEKAQQQQQFKQAIRHLKTAIAIKNDEPNFQQLLQHLTQQEVNI
jgi:tetratricopeptide (TPR) repeat protein